MKRRALAELVCEYVDDLDAGMEEADSYWEAFPQFRADLEPLFVLSHRIKGTLVPVEPSPEFANALRSRLVTAWYENKACEEARNEEARRRGWWLRAAIVGSLVSMAALTAVVARSRGQLAAVPEMKFR